MLRSIASRLTYANVMATVAVFVALGGAGYAAIKLPANSVGSAQIVNGSITGADVKNGSLTGADVRNKSLTSADTCDSKDVKACQKTTVKTAEPGPAGPPGPTGAPGRNGSDAALAPGAVTPTMFGVLPSARARSVNNPKVGHQSVQAVDLPIETFDTAALHDDAINSSRLTAPIGGTYVISGQVSFLPNGTGNRAASIVMGGISDLILDFALASQIAAASPVGETHLSVSTIARLGAGDFVELAASQSSGADLGLNGHMTHLEMAWIAP